ncbi:MAG TPA: aminotransferase class I/II-fold pyridoxal phosphate-dependent enzyme [Stellaceae bacterium]|jgi:aspartate/methionine/tyrosine aminotransferase|nr:aminotransferase class I/II-fold pyridoxal phosphate-dependent enzyme [Stellaceae bacterium]
MSVKLSRRAGVPPFIAMDVLREANERAAGGADIVHLELGQPSTPAPRAVLAAAESALRRDVLGYTDALGLPVLREAIARHYRATYGVAVDPARIVVTTGSSAGFVLAFLAAFDAGERVALASPSYPAYRNILAALDLVPVELPAGPTERFQATLSLIEAAGEPFDGLIVASPANPTGSMIGPADLTAIGAHCAAAGIRLISDEIYHGITYDKPAGTAVAANPDAIVVNSFSKYYSMTGWRIGWMVVPSAMLRAVECLAQNLFISPPTLAQHAALAAFDAGDELEANCRRYAENRALLLAELPKAGFEHFAPPDGAFYLYADIAALTNDSRDFCRRMLREIGVACTPGVDFDPRRGQATMRLCFAGATEDIAEAARRLRNWKR